MMANFYRKTPHQRIRLNQILLDVDAVAVRVAQVVKAHAIKDAMITAAVAVVKDAVTDVVKDAVVRVRSIAPENAIAVREHAIQRVMIHAKEIAKALVEKLVLKDARADALADAAWDAKAAALINVLAAQMRAMDVLAHVMAAQTTVKVVRLVMMHAIPHV